MAGWHHHGNGHELGQTSGDGEGQGGLACCSPWGCKELDMTGQLNNNDKCLFGPTIWPLISYWVVVCQDELTLLQKETKTNNNNNNNSSQFRKYFQKHFLMERSVVCP